MKKIWSTKLLEFYQKAKQESFVNAVTPELISEVCCGHEDELWGIAFYTIQEQIQEIIDFVWKYYTEHAETDNLGDFESLLTEYLKGSQILDYINSELLIYQNNN